MKIPMECIGCGARTDHAVPGDPSHEIRCAGCGGRLTSAVAVDALAADPDQGRTIVAAELGRLLG